MRKIYIICLLLFTFLLSLEAKEYYVNRSTGDDSNDGSRELPWKNVDHGLSMLMPGDVLYLFGGTYQPIDNIPGGEPGMPITIKNVEGDRVVISSTVQNNGILVTNNHISIDGFEIKDVKNNGINIQANHITIRNCIIHDTGLAIKANTKYVNHHIIIEYCSFYNFSDMAIFPDAAEKFIIRNNVMYNSESVIMDPGGVQELLIENNFITNPKNDLGALKIRWGNIEDVSGPNCNGAVVRNNIFLEGNKYTMLIASANGAMVYNNVLINNFTNGVIERGVIYMQKDPADINEGKPLGPNSRNVIKNNIIQLNGGDSFDWKHNALVEVREDMAEDITTNEFDNNLYFKSSGSLYIVSGNTWIKEQEVLGWGAQFDMHSIVGQNPELNVKDVLVSPNDFMPAENSPVIDKGGYLTVTVESGNSDVVKVRDSRYFYSGHGMIPGDEIIIGNSETAIVIDRNIEENTITVNKKISWTEGNPVSLIYGGSAPDIGAFENGIEKQIANAAGADELFKLINKDAGVSSLNDNTPQPVNFYLSQNYPNPFNSITTVRYGLKSTGNVKIIVYDVLGMEVKELINKRQIAGHHQVLWNGTNTQNQLVSSGVYYCRGFADGCFQTQKVIYVK